MRAFLPLLTATLACWSGATGQSRPAAGGHPSPEAMLARRRLWSVVDTLVLNRSSAIARYGPPVAVLGDTVRSQATPDILDSIVTIRFRTFEALYYVHRSGPTELWHVNISVPGTTVPQPASPGASRQSLLGYLGQPDTESLEEEGLLLLYALHPPDEDGNVLNILLVDDRVRWISWVFFPNEPSWPPD
jgi:hypothetical protein